MFKSSKLSTKNPLTGKKTGETSGRATEDGFFSQAGQTCSKYQVYRIDHQKRKTVNSNYDDKITDTDRL